MERHHLGGICFNVVQASRLFLFFLKTQARRLYRTLLIRNAGRMPAIPKYKFPYSQIILLFPASHLFAMEI